MGDTDVEVRGEQNVRVKMDEKTNEIVIQTGDSVAGLKSKDEH